MVSAAPAHLKQIEIDLHKQTRIRAIYSIGIVLALIIFVVLGFESADEANSGGFIQGFSQLLDFPFEIIRLSVGAGWGWFPLLGQYLPALIETFHMAMLATFIGFIGAVIVSLLASQNLVKNKFVVSFMRRIMDVSRAFPEIVLAMILLFLMGKSAVPALIAIAFHTIGALGKLFSEVNENADMRAVEGLASNGANLYQQIRYGIIPQVLPNYLSYGLLRLEINVRASTILGFVGAGGIGLQLNGSLNTLAWTQVSLILLVILVTVFISEWVSAKVRGAII